MNAIAFAIPEDVRAVCEGLAAFVEAEVVSRHESHHSLLADPRRCYAEDVVQV